MTGQRYISVPTYTAQLQKCLRVEILDFLSVDTCESQEELTGKTQRERNLGFHDCICQKSGGDPSPGQEFTLRLKDIPADCSMLVFEIWSFESFPST